MRVSRTTLLLLVVLVALVILLVQRKEGATAAGSGCYRSLGKYIDESSKYETWGVGPPLDPRQCTGMEVGYGKNRTCYKSDGTKWKEQKGKSGKCVSWVKKVDWKASPNAKNRFPVYGSYKKSSGKWVGEELGEGLLGKTVEECGAMCDANAACTGFTFAKPKGGTKTFDCWLRNNANTNIDKKEKMWYSYDKNAGGVAAATSSGSTSSGSTVANGTYRLWADISESKKDYALCVTANKVIDMNEMYTNIELKHASDNTSKGSAALWIINAEQGGYTIQSARYKDIETGSGYLAPQIGKVITDQNACPTQTLFTAMTNKKIVFDFEPSDGTRGGGGYKIKFKGSCNPGIYLYGHSDYSMFKSTESTTFFLQQV